jgi:DNA-binding response OmpR family regulator
MRARVLVVDDDEVYLAGMKELLEDSGHEVFLASSFEFGKQQLRDHAPDLLIVDVRLGAFNGLQLISTGQLRIPSIVVTGFDDTVLRADASVFGASYIVKPISPPALLALINQKLSLATAMERSSTDSMILSDGSAAVPPVAEHAGLTGAGSLPDSE